MINEEEIGKRIKSLRLKAKLTLQELSERTGLSTSYLSKMEKSKKAPPVSTLITIAKALNVTISFLLGEINEDNSLLLVKKNERPLLAQPATEFGYSYEALAHAYPDQQMFPYILTFPSKRIKRRNFKHDSQEFLFVLEGTMHFYYGNKEYIVEKGDCIYFDANIPHYGEQLGDERLVTLMIVTQQQTGVEEPS